MHDPAVFFTPHQSGAALTQTPCVARNHIVFISSVCIWFGLVCVSPEKMDKAGLSDKYIHWRLFKPISFPYFSADRTQNYSTWLSQQSLHESQTNDWHPAVGSELRTWATPKEHQLTVWCYSLGKQFKRLMNNNTDWPEETPLTLCSDSLCWYEKNSFIKIPEKSRVV